MKENKYDQDSFYQKYSQMDRSVRGLAAAGEWESLRKLLPDFQGKRVLDLGCGFGWHCRYAAEQGASRVVGTDLSDNMLAQARAQTDSPVVEYRRLAMEDMDFAPGSFDIVLSSLALHYVEDFSQVCRQVYRCLVQGGVFVFSAEHPVFTAYGNQDWFRDGEGGILHWPVDNYFAEGKRQARFLGEEVVKYHRTLTTYLGTLFRIGFSVTGVVEPQPSVELLETVPGMGDELRRPMMLLVSANKL